MSVVQVTTTEGRTSIVTHPNVVASLGQDEGIAFISVIGDPLCHVPVLAVHHEDCRLLHIICLTFGELARDAVQGERVIVLSDEGVVLELVAVFEDNLLELANIVFLRVHREGKTARARNNRSCSEFQHFVLFYLILRYFLFCA